MAFDPRDYRNGKPLEPGARASPEAVKKIEDSLDTQVSDLEARILKVKEHLSGSRNVDIILGSKGPKGATGPAGEIPLPPVIAGDLATFEQGERGNIIVLEAFSVPSRIKLPSLWFVSHLGSS